MSPDRRRSRRVTVYRAEIPHTSPPEIWEVEYEALADALHFACRDLREGRRKPLEILEDGVRVYDATSLEAACREREEQRSLEHEAS
jgi:hypothetical protein